MPNGYMNSWNAGTCCGSAVSAGLDDVALLPAIFTEVGRHVNIDLGRVYATGLSNGAIGTSAIGGGTSTTSDLVMCAPTGPAAERSEPQSWVATATS
jgi:polyhydroxybutyrate depolymerase